MNLPIGSTDPLSALNPEALSKVILGMHAWLETMRGASGYGGPVSHWWQDCLHYTGAGLDWRYQGIIAGYLNLFERTGQTLWLDKAKRAGNDLLAGQLSGGNFCASSFEANPKPGGTPHEAACDLALIRLAHALRRHDLPGWEPYAQVAERNLKDYILCQLWVPEERYFQNLVHDPVFVPNKAATIVQALSAWVDFSDEQAWVDHYIIPTLDLICSCQIHDPGSRLHGAIDQAHGSVKRQGWYFPFYNARCIPALVLGYRLRGEDRYLHAARAAMDFILRVRYEDGSFPQVIRANGRIHRFPQWVAGVGDILHALDCLEDHCPQEEKDITLKWMLQGLLPSGGMRTAHGFARKSRWSYLSNLPDFRDLLAVTGWVDKAFHYLTTLVSSGIHPVDVVLQPFEQPCLYRGRRCAFSEDQHRIEIRNKEKIVYRWQKGTDWAGVLR